MLRRTLAIMGTSAVVAVAAIAPANAEAPKLQSYAAAASGTAFELSLAGQGLAVSVTSAGISSKPAAEANGAAALLAGTPIPGESLSKSPEGPETNSDCPFTLDLGEATQGTLSTLELEITCVETSATSADGPRARSGSGEVTLLIKAPGGALLEPVLTQLFTALPTLTDPVLEALAPILGPIGDTTGIAVDDLVNDILDAVGNDLFVLAEVVIAPSLSEAYANSTDGVVARAGSSGIVINLFPGLASTLEALVELDPNPGDPDPEPTDLPAQPLDGESLVSLVLGNATAQVVLDPVTGVAKPDASAATPLSVDVNDDLGILAMIVGEASAQIDAFAVDQLACDPAANPLADVLCFEAGTVKELTAEQLVQRGYDFGPGTVGREATAASLQLLPVAADALGASVLGIQFASVDAAANAVAPAAPPAQDPLPAPAGPPLPRTGADSTWPLTLGLLGVGAAGAMLLRRSRTSA